MKVVTISHLVYSGIAGHPEFLFLGLTQNRHSALLHIPPTPYASSLVILFSGHFIYYIKPKSFLEHAPCSAAYRKIDQNNVAYQLCRTKICIKDSDLT